MTCFLLILVAELAADCITKIFSQNTFEGHELSAGTLYPKHKSVYLKLIALVAVCRAKNSAV